MEGHYIPLTHKLVQQACTESFAPLLSNKGDIHEKWAFDNKDANRGTIMQNQRPVSSGKGLFVRPLLSLELHIQQELALGRRQCLKLGLSDLIEQPL
jgi:hypothetical protein